jgi:hypothetical protein
MNVRELRAQLHSLPDEMEILVVSDPEGNGFHPLEEVGGGFIRKEDAGYRVDYLADSDDVFEGGDTDEYDDNVYLERVIFWP